jgi:hypothetical protein
VALVASGAQGVTSFTWDSPSSNKKGETEMVSPCLVRMRPTAGLVRLLRLILSGPVTPLCKVAGFTRDAPRAYAGRLSSTTLGVKLGGSLRSVTPT